MKKRYGLLRTVISKDKRIKDRIYIPVMSDDLEKLKSNYEYFNKQNTTIYNVPAFQEVAIFDYEKCIYVLNNFKEREFFVNHIRK